MIGKVHRSFLLRRLVALFEYYNMIIQTKLYQAPKQEERYDVSDIQYIMATSCYWNKSVLHGKVYYFTSKSKLKSA